MTNTQRPRRILVLGGGFAGLWAALGAARKLDELGIAPDAVEITLVNRDAWHGIRVRNYEADVTPARVPLDDVLSPVGVRSVEGDVTAIDLSVRTVTVGDQTLTYDRLVYALGSRLARPNVPGLAEFAFDVDTYAAAERLAARLAELPPRSTVAVVGAGLTGVETAAEMPARLRDGRVILVDHHSHVGADMGESARPVIEEALASLGVEMRLGVGVASIDDGGLTLSTGERIEASAVVWCAGMRAVPLGESFPVERDSLGRVAVDAFLRVTGVAHVFAAGDVARLEVDAGRPSVMSCQHGRPMGRFAGHNVVCDLLGLPMLPLRIPWYVTVLDLGAWGAVYTEGWNRHVVARGEVAKRTKRLINGERIYPPLTRDRMQILAAAAPVVQEPPGYTPD